MGNLFAQPPVCPIVHDDYDFNAENFDGTTIEKSEGDSLSSYMMI